MLRNCFISFCILALGACAATPDAADDDLSSLALLLGGSGLTAKEVEEIAAKAAAYPLGSKENPVRVASPVGERAYLQRLRCENGSAPVFQRAGSAGVGIYGFIVDIYVVECVNSVPLRSEIWMDMYHGDHVETSAPPGFNIKPPR